MPTIIGPFNKTKHDNRNLQLKVGEQIDQADMFGTTVGMNQHTYRPQ